MNAKAQALVILPKLASAELEEVIIACKVLLALSGRLSSTAAQATPPDGEFLLEGIAHYLVTKAVLATQSRAVRDLKYRDAYQIYRKKAPQVEAFLQEVAASSGTKGNRHLPQLAFLAASSLADLLKKRNIFSVGAMLTQIDKVPEALDFAFPGYIESGMFGFVLLAGKAGRSQNEK